MNWALNKPAYASSEYRTSPSVAVDGNLNSLFLWGLSCTHSLPEEDPWWVVDLQGYIKVRHVRILNRGDCCSFRLHDFNIGITNSHPHKLKPDVTNYRLCKTHIGVVGEGKWADIFCPPDILHGRFLVIQIPGVSEVLAICEVQVFGDRLALALITEQAQLANHILMTHKVHYLIDCIQLCYMINECGSVNFLDDPNQKPGLCQLNTHTNTSAIQHIKWRWVEIY